MSKLPEFTSIDDLLESLKDIPETQRGIFQKAIQQALATVEQSGKTKEDLERTVHLLIRGLENVDSK